MARVTVEDCVEKVTNRFDLVLLAAHRARLLSKGAELMVDRDNDKNPVVALREIADEKLIPAQVEEDLVVSLQRHTNVDEVDETEGENTEVPEFDQTSEDELLQALKAASMTSPQSLPKG